MERAENGFEILARAVGMQMPQGLAGWHRWHNLGMETYLSSGKIMTMLGKCLSIPIF